YAPPRPAFSLVDVILNREAGTIAKIGPEIIAEKLEQIFESEGVTAKVHLVAGTEVDAALAKALDGPGQAVIVGGGDGTVAAAATVLAGSSKPLGILPLGTFNLAARDAGMPLDWEEAARALIHAPISPSDLLDFDGKMFCCVMVLGFYPALALGRTGYEGNWMVRAWRSAIGVFRNAATFPPLHLRLTVDGRETTFRTSMAVLVNNDFEDLFGLIPRRRSLNGGFFTVYLSKHRTRWGLFLTFLSWLLGRWKQDREMTALHATKLTITVRHRRSLPVMRDGELTKLPIPFTVKLRPGALQLLAPRLLTESPETTEIPQTPASLPAHP
ncbi:MAG: hypothetical protein JWL81_2970, partial [Verrucomicrobiales bacterium]|nr:hypothetical protein [Verrucomicrobiales bacterium]